jgi:hypothetical protein
MRAALPLTRPRAYDRNEQQIRLTARRVAMRPLGGRARIQPPHSLEDTMEDLDKLAADFAARGYEPDGAELETDGPPAAHGQGHHHPVPTHQHGGGVRRFAHRGHDVEIVTRYEVTIDGDPWDQHVEVLQDGSVTYHGLPQYALPSAVDLIRKVIDDEEDTPEDLRAAARAAREEG